MFEKQIELLEKFIADWDNVAQGNPTHDWMLDAGICTNCSLGFYSLIQSPNMSYSQAEEFISAMWKEFPGYTGNVYYPICDKLSYLKMDNFTQHPERLALAKHALEYLKAMESNVAFEDTVYAKACEIIKANPEKLSVDQLLKELNIPFEKVNPQEIDLAFAWASQAHIKYL